MEDWRITIREKFVKKWKYHINNIGKIRNKKVAKEYSENPEVLQLWKRKEEIAIEKQLLWEEEQRINITLGKIEQSIFLKQNPHIEPPPPLKEDEDLFSLLMK